MKDTANDSNPRSRKSTIPHIDKRRYPIGVDPRRQRRQERAAERLALAAALKAEQDLPLEADDA